MGETAALIYTAGTVAQVPTNVFGSGRTLAVHMYNLSSEEDCTWIRHMQQRIHSSDTCSRNQHDFERNREKTDKSVERKE